MGFDRPNNYVYFLWDRRLNRVKIGRSWNPKKRLQHAKLYYLLETYPDYEERRKHFDDVVLLGYIPAEDIELRIQQVFQKERLRGEWFEKSSRLRRFILTSLKENRPCYETLDEEELL